MKQHKAGNRQTPCARATKATGAEARCASLASCNSAVENEIKVGGRGPPVVPKHKPEQIKSMPSPVFHLSTTVKIFHTLAGGKKEGGGEKREGGKFTAIITLHQHTQISLFFSSFFFTFQVKGCASFILQRHANLSVSPSPSFQ